MALTAMALSGSEAEEVYITLASTLRDRGMGWLVDDVEARISEGKVTTRDITLGDLRNPRFSALWPSELLSQYRKNRRMPRITRVESYNIWERLLFLIEAIEHAVPTANALARESLLLSRSLDGPLKLVFAPEGEMKQGFSIDSASIAGHVTASERLTALLKTLRQEAGDGIENRSP
jgi:hypothetical protein